MLHWKPPGYYSMEVSVLLLTYGHSVTSFLCRLWHFKAKALTTRRANIVDGYYQVFVPSGNTFTSQILTVTGDIVFVCNFLGNAEISSLECSCWSLWHESKRLKLAILLCRCMPELIFVSGLHFLSSEGIHSSSDLSFESGFLWEKLLLHQELNLICHLRAGQTLTAASCSMNLSLFYWWKTLTQLSSLWC